MSPAARPKFLEQSSLMLFYHEVRPGAPEAIPLRTISLPGVFPGVGG